MTDMDEELQKRNTDCVYFLASPLTCKKGAECEYRHSEKARFNPRDCWYWISANCLNPTCAFRHPPLDGPSPKAAEPAVPKNHGSTAAPGNKIATPCHFYFSGFCIKGDNCQFLHGHDGISAAVKPLKPEALPSENKSSGSETGSVPKILNKSLPANAKKSIMHKNVDIKEELQRPVLRSKPQSISPRVSDSEFEEAARVKPVPLLRAEGIIQSRSNICTDQSSEDQVDDHVEPEERLESSPGFDVLVNNKMENLDYEDNSDFLVGMDGEHGEHFMGYDQDVYDAYDPLDNEHGFDNGRRPLGHMGERRSDSVFSEKRRRLLPDELPIDVRGGMDLREHLRGLRAIDERPTNHLSRQHESSRLNGRIQRRPQPQRHGVVPVSQRLQGRLASRVEIVNGTSSNGFDREHHGGWHRGGDSNSHRQHYRDRRAVDWHSGSGEFSRKRRSSPEDGYSSFSGPKSLSQIREEKNRLDGNGGYAPVGFEGPKPLREILKDKGRLSSE